MDPNQKQFAKRKRDVRMKSEAGRLWATVFPMIVPGFQQSGEKGCGKIPGYLSNQAQTACFDALHTMRCGMLKPGKKFSTRFLPLVDAQ
jgi:hypothetical protein